MKRRGLRLVVTFDRDEASVAWGKYAPERGELRMNIDTERLRGANQWTPETLSLGITRAFVQLLLQYVAHHRPQQRLPARVLRAARVFSKPQ